MAHYVRFTVVPNVHQGTVFGEELSNRVIPRHAAMLTQGYDDFVLQRCLPVQENHPTSYRNIPRRSPGAVAQSLFILVRMVSSPFRAPSESPAKTCSRSILYCRCVNT